MNVVVGDLGYGVSEYPVSSEMYDAKKNNMEEAEWIITCIKGD